MSVLTKSAGGGLVLVLVILAVFGIQARDVGGYWHPGSAYGGHCCAAGNRYQYLDANGYGIHLGARHRCRRCHRCRRARLWPRTTGKTRKQAAVDGTWEVSTPVIFGVLTTIAAFLPLVLVQGQMADFFAPIGWIVIFALFFSIIESQLILPSHLINRGKPSPGNRFVEAFKSLQTKLGSGLEDVAYNTYRPFMDNVMTWRYATSAVFGITHCCPVTDSERPRGVWLFPCSGRRSSLRRTGDARRCSGIGYVGGSQKNRRASQIVNEEMGQELGLSEPLIRHTLVSVGTKSERSGPSSGFGGWASNISKSLSIWHRFKNEAIFLQKQSPIAGVRLSEVFRTR